MEVRDDGKCLIRSFILVKSFYPCIVAHMVPLPLPSAGRAPLLAINSFSPERPYAIQIYIKPSAAAWAASMVAHMVPLPLSRVVL